jgi:cyclophilin family peptidyl-prolyl cis-trans isomerase
VPAISEADYVFGPEDAPVTLIEYCDFQAPICRSMAAVVGNLSAKHPGQIRVVFRPVPLVGQLDKTELAVQAAIAAGDQDKFWEMYDVLFVKSDQWDALTPELFEDWVTQEASGLGMNGSQFKAGMKSQATVDRMTSMFNAARDFGLDRIPLVLINGSPQPTFAIDYTSIEAAVSLITLAERQFTTCPSFEIDPAKQYIATLHTAKGDIVLELYADKAPQTVNSFVFLARQGWFDGVTFHRVIPGFMAQTGDPSGTGRGNPGYLFKNEIDPSLKFDKPGILAMANSGPDTNGSQFFITYAPAAHLDGLHTIFGRVLSGMDVLESLTPRDSETSASLPAGDLLLTVEIQEK